MEKRRHRTMSHCWPQTKSISVRQPKNLTCQAFVMCVMVKVWLFARPHHHPHPIRIPEPKTTSTFTGNLCVLVSERKWILLCYTWPMTTTTEAAAKTTTPLTTKTNWKRTFDVSFDCHATGPLALPFPSLVSRINAVPNWFLFNF